MVVAHSLSILSSHPSTSSTTTTATAAADSFSYPSRSFSFSRRNPNTSSKPLAHTLSPPRALSFFRASSEDDSTAAEQFLENNSIADFMRFRKGSGDGGGGDGELQTAVVGYRKKFPWSLLRPFLRVDLVSTIHIADKAYFTTLQKQLEPYDCVLYEMVASRESLENRKSAAAKKRLKSSRSRGFNILGFIQRQMDRILTLDFQLDCLDYDAENWYHADLDFETFKLLQGNWDMNCIKFQTMHIESSFCNFKLERGESFFTFAKDMTLKSTKAMMQPTILENLDPRRSKLLWASRVLPMPLVGLLIIGSICTDVGDQVSEYSELDAV